jgi:hypothetical protein
MSVHHQIFFWLLLAFQDSSPSMSWEIEDIIKTAQFVTYLLIVAVPKGDT